MLPYQLTAELTQRKYQDLKREISTMWAMRKVEVIPVVVVALGAIGAEDRITRNCKNTKREIKI